jgi:riboflavin synthase
MFGGIVEEVGEVAEPRAGQLRVHAAKVLEEMKLGGSIGMDAVDLTVSGILDRTLTFDVMPERVLRRRSAATRSTSNPTS